MDKSQPRFLSLMIPIFFFLLTAWLLFNDSPLAAMAQSQGNNERVTRENAAGNALITRWIFPSNLSGFDGGLQPGKAKNAAWSSLWVNGVSGNDQNSGTTFDEPLKTVQAALDRAIPGIVIHIEPGIYRESLVPKTSGTATEPIILLAEKGRGTVSLRGSEPSSTMVWAQLSENNIGLPQDVDPKNIFVTDLSSWGLAQAPRFVVSVDEKGQVTSRWLPAREPDYRVDTEWKYAEFWWSANGGFSIAGCDPTKNIDQDCDLSNRSFTQLTDTRDDADPQGVEPGNLTTFGDLAGATLVAMDAHHAHYVYRRTILKHDVSAGRVTVEADCDNDGEPGLGWGSKYYVENAPALLDQPGEWWFDSTTGRLYLWPPSEKNPAQLNLEISHLNTGFDLSDTSYLILEGLTVELYNQNAYQIVNRNKSSLALGNQIKNSLLQYANKGIVLYHFVQGADDRLAIDGFTLKNSEVAFMDSAGLDSSFGWAEEPLPLLFTYAGVRNLVIRDNEFHHLGFNSSDRSAVGVRIFYPDKIRFEGNSVHHIAQNGAHFHLSLIDSEKTYGLNPEEIKLGEILIQDNIFEKTCQAASDCGGLKIGGNNRPYTHVFRDVLITGNTFRHIFGWSSVSIQRRLNTLGDGNGFYLDYASGVHVYRNMAYNNSGAGFKLSCLWRDGAAVLYNNVAVNNYLYGIKTTGKGSCDNHGGSINTQFVNNILANNGLSAFEILSAYSNNFGNLNIDHNIYYQNGWDRSVGGRSSDILLYPGFLPPADLHGLDDIRAGTPWEEHGIEADPVLQDFSVADHTEFQYPTLTFQPTSQSFHLVNSGSTELPASLVALLARFGVEDVRCGSAYDIGRFEIYKALPDFATQDSQSEWPDSLLTPVCQRSLN